MVIRKGEVSQTSSAPGPQSIDILGGSTDLPQIERLELMVTGQVSTGGAMPVVNRISHKPGKEIPPAEEQYRSDDCLWLFNTIPA